MNCFASSLAALALLVVPSLAHAQEGGMGPANQAATPAAPRTGALPSVPAPPRPVRYRMRSTPMMVSGIIVGSIGTGLLIGGVVMAKQAADAVTCTDPQSSWCGLGVFARGPSMLPGLTVAILGGSLFLTGAVLTPLGASPIAKSGAEPMLSLGPGSARLTWRF